MERTPQENEVALFAAPPLLITESADEFAALLAALQQEIRPTGIIEQIYLHDLTAIVWDIQRLRRYRTEIVNNAFRTALQSLLTRLLPIPHIRDRVESEKKAAELAHAWFKKKMVKRRSWQYCADLIATNPPSKPKRSDKRGQTLSWPTKC